MTPPATKLPEPAKHALEDALARCSLRATRQREHVFGVLLSRRDHPTADEVYARARADMPSISLATVYNCLETLVECGLVRQVHIEREPTRFCPNLTLHAHFYCRRTGAIHDIEIPPEIMDALKRILPPGFVADRALAEQLAEIGADRVDLAFRGTTPDAPSPS